jgi:hypothetical protein
MPYHRLGVGKYEALDKVYPLGELPSPELEYLEGIRGTFEGLGVRCFVSR